MDKVMEQQLRRQKQQQSLDAARIAASSSTNGCNGTSAMNGEITLSNGGTCTTSNGGTCTSNGGTNKLNGIKSISNGASLTNGHSVGAVMNGTSHRDANDWTEFSIDVPWGTVQGKWWGSRNLQPILALHGWQDNAGTYDNLCPLISPDLALLCLDLPGHGKSSPYPQGMQYFLFWDGIMLLRRIIRRFNWKHVTLMGHSLGGALTFMYAASFPTEVAKLINIDIYGPAVRSIERQANMTGWAIDKQLDYETLPEDKLPCYSYDEMIKLVLDAYAGSVDEPSVKILMKRGMEPAPKYLHKEGYHFARDLRLKVSMLGQFTEEQMMAYAKRIRCKVLNVRGDPGMVFENPDMYDKVMETLKQNAELVIYTKVPGTHHLHLVTPERVAPHINNFLTLE